MTTHHNEAETLAGLEALLKHLVHRYSHHEDCLEGSDWEDLMQDARLTALEAIRSHDPERASLPTWVFLKVKGMLTNKLRHAASLFAYRDRRQVEEPVTSTRPDVLVEAYHQWLRLDPVERDILAGRVAGETFEEIGKRHGFSKARAHQIAARTRRVY